MTNSRPGPYPAAVLKTGIDAQAEVIPGEDPAALEALAAELFAEHQPASPTEAALVDAIIHHTWLQRRLRKIEAEIRETAARARALSPRQTRALSGLHSRLNSTGRSLRRNLKVLASQQSNRPAINKDAVDFEIPALPIRLFEVQ